MIIFCILTTNFVDSYTKDYQSTRTSETLNLFHFLAITILLHYMTTKVTLAGSKIK